jgi:mannosyltransferase
MTSVDSPDHSPGEVEARSVSDLATVFKVPARCILALALTPRSGAAALVILAGLLRFYHLGSRSLWLDEVFTAQIVRLPTLGDVITTTHEQPDQMPLLYLIVWALRGLGGAEWAVRLPAAIAGTLSVLAIYLVGKTLFRPRVGFVAAFLAAILTFSIWYGQEARAYSLLMLFTTLQMLFAYRAIVNARPGDWAALVFCSVLNLYTHYMALAATAAALIFVVLSLALEAGGLAISRLPARERSIPLRQLYSKVGFAIGAALLTTLAYVPWLPYLQGFLASKSVGLGRVSSIQHVSLQELQALLAAFNLSGVLLVLLAIGLAVPIYVLIRESNDRRAAGLLLCWVLVPSAGLWFKLQGSVLTLVPRYYIFLYPAALLVVALGVEAIAVAAGSAFKSLKSAPWLMYGIALLAFLPQTLPALANSYTVPKDDYRGAATRILAASSPRSVVLALGGGDAFISQSLGYYFWLLHSAVRVVNGSELDSLTVARLKHRDSRVWGAVFTSDGSNYFTTGPPHGFDVVPLVGITLLHPRNQTTSPIRQAMTLLQWGSKFQPELAASASLLKVLDGSVTLGVNVLPPLSRFGPQPAPGAWWLTSGATLSADSHHFTLVTTGPEVDAVSTADIAKLHQQEVLSFQYHDGGSSAQPKVYVVANGLNGQILNTFPNGAGYVCPQSRAWTSAAFALRVPPGTGNLTIWLRTEGAGSTEFKDVQLRSLGS